MQHTIWLSDMIMRGKRIRRFVGAFSLQNSYWPISFVDCYQIPFETAMTCSGCFITLLCSIYSANSVPAQKALGHVFPLVLYCQDLLWDSNVSSTFLLAFSQCHFLFLQ